jgi:hypothetical protein
MLGAYAPRITRFAALRKQFGQLRNGMDGRCVGSTGVGHEVFCIPKTALRSHGKTGAIALL